MCNENRVLERKIQTFCCADEINRGKAASQERFTFFHTDGIQILAYIIPGMNGFIRPRERLINCVWYYNDKQLLTVCIYMLTKPKTDALGRVEPKCACGCNL